MCVCLYITMSSKWSNESEESVRYALHQRSFSHLQALLVILDQTSAGHAYPKAHKHEYKQVQNRVYQYIIYICICDQVKVRRLED